MIRAVICLRNYSNPDQPSGICTFLTHVEHAEEALARLRDIAEDKKNHWLEVANVYRGTRAYELPAPVYPGAELLIYAEFMNVESYGPDNEILVALVEDWDGEAVDAGMLVYNYIQPLIDAREDAA